VGRTEPVERRAGFLQPARPRRQVNDRHTIHADNPAADDSTGVL